MTGTIGRILVALTLMVGIWAFFVNDVEIVVFQRYLADGSVVDRVDNCGTIFDVLTGRVDSSVDGGVGIDRCVRSARTDAVFGGLLGAVVIAAGFMMISTSYRRPMIGIDDVRPLPSRSIFGWRKDAHKARADELASRND